MVVAERTEGGPATAPVEAYGHSTSLEKVRNMDALAQRRAEVVERAVHNASIAVLGAAGPVSSAWTVISQAYGQCRFARTRASANSHAARLLAEATRVIFIRICCSPKS